MNTADKIRSTYTRKRASLGSLSLNHLNYRNPFISAAWSIFFPGFGYILLCEYVQGWILFLWEVFVNVKSNFNTAILFAFTGRFQESIQTLTSGGTYWILLYGVMFCFAVFANYHLSVEVNNMYFLAYEENVPVEIFNINAFHYNFLFKRSPWVTAIWSLLMPGLGGMWNRRLIASVFFLIWWIVCVQLSHTPPAIVYTFTGHFAQATAVLNPEWFLFLPSIYGFSFYNSYILMVEQNNLFDKQQANYLKVVYQSSAFPFHLKEKNKMRIISTFDHSLYLEKAIVTLEKQGIQKEKIFAVPMKKSNESSTISLDTIHHSSGQIFLDIPSLVATFLCALCTIYGFVLHWGPVLWGLIGFIGGFIIGCIIKVVMIKLSSNRAKKRSKTEVVLMIDCDKELVNKVEQILWSNQAFGVSVVGADG